jgi:hypothetical protein
VLAVRVGASTWKLAVKYAVPTRSFLHWCVVRRVLPFEGGEAKLQRTGTDRLSVSRHIFHDSILFQKVTIKSLIKYRSLIFKLF